MTPARIKFLISLASAIKNGSVKKISQAVAFARQQFGKVDDNFLNDIINVFKKEGKTKKGGIVDIKTRKEYKKELDETLGPADDVFGSPIKDQKMKEFDKAAAKDVTPKTDKAKKLNLTELEAKLDEIDKERAIRIRKQSEEVERRTGKPFKEGPYLEDDVNLKGEINPITDQMSNQQREILGFPNRTVEAIIRTAARDVLEKAGLGPRIKGQDPIDMARQIYGDEILDALDNISGELLEASSYPEIARILTEKKIYNFKPRQGLDVRQKGEIEDITAFDPEGRDPNADGGLIDILKL